MVPFTKPVILVVTAGNVGNAVGVMFTKIPVPAVGVLPLADDKVGTLGDGA